MTGRRANAPRSGAEEQSFGANDQPSPDRFHPSRLQLGARAAASFAAMRGGGEMAARTQGGAGAKAEEASR
jgi:hypothetical protein